MNEITLQEKIEKLSECCHEGITITRDGYSGGDWEAYICSNTASGKTFEEAIENLWGMTFAKSKTGNYGC